VLWGLQIKPLISAHEFLHNKKRFCFWLDEISPNELKSMPKILVRVEKVKETRLKITRLATIELASFLIKLMFISHPKSSYVLIPLHSFEKRNYIPMGYFDENSIANNSTAIIPNTTLYHFGVLMGAMHMAWVKYTCGKLESRFRYSKDIVYNNFPWLGVDGEIPNKPELKNDKLKTKIEECAKQVLEVRTKFKDASLADLYDPLAMPPELTKAHQKLDKALKAYRRGGFKDDVERVEWLFEIYKGFNG